MFKTLLRIAFVVLVFLAVLWIGGASWESFKEAVGMKNPLEVLSPLVEHLPELPDMSKLGEIKDDSGSFIDYMHRVEIGKKKTEDTGTTETTEAVTSDSTETEVTTEIITETTEKQTEANTTGDPVVGVSRETTITIGDQSVDMSRTTTIDLLSWLSINWSFDVNVEFKHNESTTTNTTNQTTEQQIASIDKDKLYSTKLESKENLNALIATIRTIDELPEYDYDRTVYEKSSKSYKLNGHKLNRNDYSWQTSPWFNGEDFTYQCPYTGTILNDLDDGKEDYDFGQLDYDHIVPLKSAHLRGGKDWSDDKKNEYAYDQFVGVCVLNKANRSKSDKGPAEYLPDINVEDYCYSWLLICSKYDLAMTPQEIQICKDNIEIALDNGDEVTHMGGSYEVNE